MIWQDVFINRILNSQEIKKGLSTIFPVSEDDILVVSDISSEECVVDDEIKILCETWVSKTDFPYSITIYLRNEKIIPVGNKIESDILKIGKFCEVLKCEALIGDDTVNPFLWVLIKNNTEFERISINEIGAFDNREPYKTI